MAKRIKPEIKTKKIESVADANDVMKEIGLLEIELAEIENETKEKIIRIKDEGQLKATPLQQKIEELSSSIGIYAEYNKNELFNDKKSIELTFGTFGFRKSTSISVKKTTLELLKDLKMFKHIRIKEEPNKDTLSDLSDEELMKVDASRKVVDDFFVETNKESIKKTV